MIAAGFIVDRAPPSPARSPLLGATDLSAMARSIYAENRKVANGKAQRVLGWSPRYPDYEAELAPILARESK